MGNERHQIWAEPGRLPRPDRLQDRGQGEHPLVHDSQVLPINSLGQPTVSFDATGKTVRRPAPCARLPPSTIYGFNGTFPGPMINAEYGKPCLVRFDNQLDENPMNLDRQDFGAPDWSFLTHLHNGHTAPESDGNPHYSMKYGPKQPRLPARRCGSTTCTSTGRPAATTARSRASSGSTTTAWTTPASNVYKGMVGLYPIYDPKNGMDMGDETPGPAAARAFAPTTPTARSTSSTTSRWRSTTAASTTASPSTRTSTTAMGEFPAAGNPRKHPEWWGKTFFKHFPNHGFVGDIFTVNGTAYPVLEVKRRKYRFRFLDASVARIYEFKLMSSTQGPKSAASLGYTGDELQGQYRIPDGQQCMKFTQIASDGGLLPLPIPRDSFELWPAKRREVIVDFTKYRTARRPPRAT